MDQNINLFIQDEMFFYVGRTCAISEIMEGWNNNFTPFENCIYASGRSLSEVLSLIEEEPFFCEREKKGYLKVFIRCCRADGKDVLLLDYFFSRFRGLRTQKWFSLFDSDEERVDFYAFFRERESVSPRYLSDLWQKSRHLRIYEKNY